MRAESFSAKPKENQAALVPVTKEGFPNQTLLPLVTHFDSSLVKVALLFRRIQATIILQGSTSAYVK